MTKSGYPEKLPPSTDGLIEVALRIAEKRKAILNEMPAALQSNDDKQLKKLALQLCGIEADD